MGRDTIQLEDVVSTISEEYLLEFTSEYGIPESLNPELPGPEEPIVEFPEGKVGVYTKYFYFANYCIPILQFLFDILGYYQIHLSQLPVIVLQILPRYEGHGRGVRILRDTFRHREIAAGLYQRRPPQMITEMDGMNDQVQDGMSHEIPLVETAMTTKVVQEPGLEKEVAAMGPSVNKRRRKMGNDEAEANAPPKVLRKDHVAFRPVQKTPADAMSVGDPEPLSFRKTALEIPTENVATMEVQDLFSMESPGSGKSTSVPSVDGSPGGIYQPGWGVTNNCHMDTLDTCQDMVDHIVPPGYFSELRHLPNTDFLSQYNIKLARQVAMGSQLRLRFEQEVRLLKKAKAKIARRDQKIQAREEEIKKMDQEIKSFRTVEEEVHGLHNQKKNLETLLEAEVDMKKAAEAKNAGLAKELETSVSNSQTSKLVIISYPS
ncbi:hypothetical protein Tco_1252067, partial [Tanacetum coccineum]